MDREPDYNYLKKLNDAQRDAVVYKDGPSLVIAGAGSGKTRVLTYKIVDLLHTGYDPSRILALTFTNKAAREMKERVSVMVGDRISYKLWMGTFHSIFLRILRIHYDKIGFQSGFTIYDAADSKSLVKTIIRELGLDDKVYKPTTVATIISNAKNALVSPQQYINDSTNYEADRKAQRPLVGRIYQLYCERCRIANAMDFDDILVYMNILLRDYEDVRVYYQQYFQYILVDEYQDTNFAQHLIISMLSKERGKLCVVGDDAQSIYSFRGANIANILNMKDSIPNLKIFKLEENYRSTQNIINAAGSLINKNSRQIRKNVFSNNEVGSPIEVVKTYSDMEEAFMVASMILKKKYMLSSSLDEFAILYRTNAQSRLLEEALRKRNIPYRIYGGLSFYQRKEIKDAVAYFRLAVNPNDDEALRRIINYPARGIGETTLKKLVVAATESRKSIWEVLQTPEEFNMKMNKGTLSKLNEFRKLIQTFIDDNRKGSNAFELGQLIYNATGILSSLANDKVPENVSRLENFSELLSGLKEFVELHKETGDEEVGMSNFLSEVSLATDMDSEDESDMPKVTLMTVHAAKGLEFSHIFIVGVEEQLFPSMMSMDSLQQIEEERRLMYVAITRAKKSCTITYAGSRFRNGQTVFSSPSRFIREIDSKYMNFGQSLDFVGSSTQNLVNSVNVYSSSFGMNHDSREMTKSKESKRTSTGVSHNSYTDVKTYSNGKEGSTYTPNDVKKISISSDGALKSGTKIKHNRFGIGIIRTLEEISGNEVITVDFGVVGIKKLLLKYAKFDILS
ncbi:MAG: UvrD-helicase domain-containing protein [Muribaculaceae bacterium]|nr:UvrD-helicase domain-containing protein [Muribaculaceae bacterium]